MAGAPSSVEVVADEVHSRRGQPGHRAGVDAVDPHRLATVAPQEVVDDPSVDVTGEAEDPTAGGVEQADEAAGGRAVRGQRGHGSSLRPSGGVASAAGEVQPYRSRRNSSTRRMSSAVAAAP